MALVEDKESCAQKMRLSLPTNYEEIKQMRHENVAVSNFIQLNVAT